MARDYSPHEWADHYTARAYAAQVDADRHAAAAEQAAATGDNARAHYLRTESVIHQQVADNYTESASRSARLAARMDDLRQTYGRTERGEPVTEADWLRNRRT